MSLDAACFGAKPQSFEEIMRMRASESWRGRYGEPEGEIIHVPGYCEYNAKDQVLVNGRKAVVLRADHELGIIEVMYGDARR